MEEKSGKKRLWIYLGIAYGVTFLMGLFMWYGRGSEMDLNVFPIAQMMYPAAGVILGYLVTRKGTGSCPGGFSCCSCSLRQAWQGWRFCLYCFPISWSFWRGHPSPSGIWQLSM